MKNNTFGSLYAIDSLGRRLCSEDQVGPARKDRYVGMFYFLTHGAGFDEASGEEGAKKIHPVNITEMLKEHPEAKMDYDHPGWKGSPLCWGEPLYGYYHQKDEWVLRKHIEMLTAAGVDFLVFDTTNRVTFSRM